MLTPPEGFGVVEEGIYRCDTLDTLGMQYVATLGLKLILSLNPEKPGKTIRAFTSEHGIQLVHLGMRPWRSRGSQEDSWMVLGKDIIQDSVRYVLDRREYPVLVVDGTCAFVGVLRRLQHWNYSSVVAEYRAFSGGKPHYMTEIFLELIQVVEKGPEENDSVRRDDSTDRILQIALPEDDVLPEWYQRQRQLWREEVKTLTKVD